MWTQKCALVVDDSLIEATLSGCGCTGDIWGHDPLCNVGPTHKTTPTRHPAGIAFTLIPPVLNIACYIMTKKGSSFAIFISWEIPNACDTYPSHSEQIHTSAEKKAFSQVGLCHHAGFQTPCSDWNGSYRAL